MSGAEYRPQPENAYGADKPNLGLRHFFAAGFEFAAEVGAVLVPGPLLAEVA